jgi:outer membrane protein OmpA-like peptidoglycan-associated protein/tetratricopeptide (TPR) repeat protein
MLKKLLYLSLFLNFFPLFSQNDPCITSDKKLIKLLANAMGEETFEDKTAKFAEAMQKFPDNAETYFLYAKLCSNEANFLMREEKTYSKGEAMQQKALPFYQNTIKKCSNFHADCYYIIGASLLQNGDLKNAVPYFQKFVDFPQDDFSKLPENFLQKKKEIESILEDVAFEKNMLENPVPFVPKKVQMVSSKLDEYFPMISPDNDLLFYTRKIDRKNLGDISSNIREEFTISSRADSKGSFTPGDPLPKPFNDGTFFNYGTATLSVDNKEMIICACKVEKVYNQDYLNCDLYTTTYKRSGKGGNDFEWTTLVNMGPAINTKDGWEAQPSLSADGSLLFFTSLRKDSRSDDIYISEKQKDGTWSKAKPFDLINTEGKDKSPFFHQDGETLYFVSNSTKKRKGLGGLDIFYIRKEGDKWTQPKNIGYPINSKEDELGLFVSTNGKEAYYSSMKEGDWDIYSFDLYEEARPQEVVILKGELIDEQGKSIQGAEIEITYNDTGEKSQFKVNGDDGKYAAVVKVSQKQDITVSVNKVGYAFNAKVIEKETFEKRDSPTIKTGKLKIDTVEVGKSFSIDDIVFASDSYILTQKSQFILNGLASYLSKSTHLKVAINGHTDDLGDDEKNRQLSQNRSDAVKNYLVEKGIEADRLTAKGFGETKPKFQNTNDANRAKNRRTEFEVVE